MTNPLAVDKSDLDRVGGADAVFSEMRQFQKLIRLPIDDKEIAHRMITSPARVKRLRKLYSNGRVSLKDLGISYRARLLLGKHGIRTVGDLYSHSERELLAFRGLGPKTLQHIREQTHKEYEYA